MLHQLPSGLWLDLAGVTYIDARAEDVRADCKPAVFIDRGRDDWLIVPCETLAAAEAMRDALAAIGNCIAGPVDPLLLVATTRPSVTSGSLRTAPVVIWQHDCESCRSLGPYQAGEIAYDLYWCPTGGPGKPTIVARHGNDGPAYVSGFELSSAVPALQEAANRARTANLYAVGGSHDRQPAK